MSTTARPGVIPRFLQTRNPLPSFLVNPFRNAFAIDQIHSVPGLEHLVLTSLSRQVRSDSLETKIRKRDVDLRRLLQPLGMETSRLVDAFVRVSAEIVALRLKQVGR